MNTASSHSRAAVDPTTLVTASVRMPSRRPYLSASRVSAVSPLCVTPTNSVRSSRGGQPTAYSLARDARASTPKTSGDPCRVA
jgi:hypothetical protein